MGTGPVRHGHVAVVSSGTQFLQIQHLFGKIPPNEPRCVLSIRDSEQRWNAFAVDHLDVSKLDSASIHRWKDAGRLSRRIEELLKSSIGSNPYILYTPHIRLPLARFLSVQEQCVQVTVIEEGLAAYRKVENAGILREVVKSLPTLGLRNLAQNIRIGGRAHHATKSSNYIALLPEAWPSADPKQVTSIPLRQLIPAQAGINDALIVLAPPHRIPLPVQQAVANEVCSALAGNCRVNLAKHPDMASSQFRDLFMSCPGTPRDVTGNVEAYLECRFLYGFNSSVLLYAKALGAKTASFSPISPWWPKRLLPDVVVSNVEDDREAIPDAVVRLSSNWEA